MPEHFIPVRSKGKQKIISAKQVNLKEFTSVLVVAPYNIEDFILATPAIAALKEALPQEGRITAVISGEVKEVAMNTSCIDDILVFKTFNPAKKMSALVRIASGGFDLMVNFNPDILTAVTLGFINGAKARVAYESKANSKLSDSFHNLRLQTIDQPQHKIIRYLSLVRFIGANSYDFMPKISIPEPDAEYAMEFFKKNGIKPGDILVGIHPAMKNEKKRWSINQFARLTNNLIDKFGVKVIVFSRRDEKDRLNEFNVVTKKKAIIVDTFEYMKMAAIAKFMSCYVCNEDDLMHVFSPFTSIIAIWGNTDPEVNKPAGHHNVIITSLEGNADSVPVSKVMEAVKIFFEHEPAI